MRKKWRWLIFALFAGSLLRLNNAFQPFRLRALNVKSFSPELEWSLREWSESFLTFCPAWFWNRGRLTTLEAVYPFRVNISWEALKGRLTLTPEPFVPKIKAQWQHAEYLVSKEGTTWRSDRWEKSLALPLPELPVLRVGNNFPLLSGLGLGSSVHLLVSFDWLYSILEIAKNQGDVTISEVELNRRGGEDVLTCQLENLKKRSRVSFIGRVNSLAKDLAVAKELMSSKAEQQLTLDATYEDKVIIRKISAPAQP